MTLQPAPDDGHVVMVVANDVVNDSRVLREGAWLARAGLRVSVLGIASGPARDVVAVDRVLVVRLPLSREVTSSRARDQARRRSWRPLPAALARAEGRQVAADVERLLDAGGEPAGRSQDLGSRVARRIGRSVHRRALRTGERVDEAAISAWGAFDTWRTTESRLVRWERVVGDLVADYEATFAAAIDELAPDVVHAHDVHLLGLAVRASRRAAAAGRVLKVVYDAHEFVPGMAVAGRRTARTNAAWTDFEQHHLRHADAVVTVGAGVAAMIAAEHGLDELPAVVLNVPVPAPSPEGHRSSPSGARLREACGLTTEVPLLVYSGTLSSVRGVDLAVRALAELPGVHLAVVCVPRAGGPVVQALHEQAVELGCADRLHLLDPVPPGEVVRFLSGADVGLITMEGGWPNHENAMPNKFFEYLRAGVPLVVTDLVVLGAEVRTGGLGRTFVSGSASSLAGAVRDVLADLTGTRGRVLASRWRTEGDWRVQETRLREVYERLLHRDLGATGPADAHEPADDGTGPGATPGRRPVDRRPLSLAELPAASARRSGTRLSLGPVDPQGSTRALAAAVRELLPAVEVQVSAVNPGADAAIDRPVKRPTYHRSLSWQLGELQHLLSWPTHVLVDDVLPLAGSGTGRTALRELRYLTHLGVRCGVLLHEVPSDLVRAQVAELVGLGVAVLVSDPGLVGAVPGARWLPSVLPEELLPEEMSTRTSTPQRRLGGTPLVACADPVARALVRGPVDAGEVALHEGPLDDLGLPVAPSAVDAVVLGADGAGSRTAVRVMASGGLLVAGTTGPGPWVAMHPSDPGDPWWRRLADREDVAARREAGPGWVRSVHDGSASVAVLRAALGLGPG